MKNKFVLILVLLFTINAVFAQKNTVQLVSSNDTETVLSFKLNSFDFKDVKTPEGNEVIINSEGLTSILQKGSPDLPKFTESIIIPDIGKTGIEIISSDFYEIEDVNIAPSKGNFTRDIDPSTVPYEYGDVYLKDNFFPDKIADDEKPYIVRDFRGQAIHVYPFSYNPVKNILRVYTEITVKVISEKAVGENEFKRLNAFDKIDREFKQIYSNHFINFEYQTKYTPIEEEGNMLIICYDDWTADVQPLVDWKNTIGRPCEMITVTEAGSSASAIKSYVTDYYNTNGLTYLLLIGDAAQVPTNSGGGLGGDSDNAYAYITGNDHYLEFFVGRFSAENPSQVVTQVLRTIEYEKGDQLTDGWLNMLMSVGSDQGPGDDNEYDYEHLRNMQTDLVGFTYVEPFYEHFDGSQGGYDQPGSPTSSEVGASLNTGLGIANYTGHGSTTAWSSSGFSSSNVNTLTNDNKLPFIWSVACVNGNFVGTTCFAEAWLRATNGDEPTGAIATMMSTINQSWDPPMAAQDEMVDLLVGTSSNGIKRTFGGLSINGCFLMNDEYSDFAMTDTWTCFGNPALFVRTDNPSDMTISHNDVVIIGESNFDITCDLDDAIATLSRNGDLIGSTVVSGGVGSIPVLGITPGETLTLAVVGFNKVTYLASLDVISPSGPYLVVETYVNEVNYGQSVDLDIVLENVGQDDATGVVATVTTSDPNASISNGTFSFGDIPAGTISSASSGAFSLTVDNDLEDQYQVVVNISISDGSKTLWQQSKMVTINAPVLTVGNLIIDDAGGNGDGILDPGETANLNIESSNTGHADIANVIGQIATTSPYLILNSVTTSPFALTVGESQVFSFNVTASPAAAEGTVADILFDITGGTANQYTGNYDFEVIIGFVPEYCTASGGCDEYIENVLIGDIDNTSACDGYYDFTDISTDVDMGGTYPITVMIGNDYSSDEVSAFVDWNYDGDFDDANEVFVLNWSAPIASGNIIVPEGITPRAVRMRVRLTYNGEPPACGTTSYGEVEDYSLNVLPGITQGGTLNVSSTMICIGSNTGDITLTNNSGTVTDWEKQLNGGGWTSIGFTGSTYSETPATDGTWEYRVEVDNGSDFSTVAAIIVSPVTVAGGVSGGSTICEGESTGTMTLNGHTGNVMKWQKQLDGGVWTDIANNGTTYSEIPTADGTWAYCAVVKSGMCSEENSGTTDVLVNPSAMGGTANATETDICTGSTATITLTAYEGSIQWQESSNGTDWTDISGAVSAEYTSGTLTDNMFYRANVSLGSCADAQSNNVEITVSENPEASYTFTTDNQELSFANTSTAATNYSWDFGDGNTSTEENPVYSYASPGSYTVVLTAINGICPNDDYSETIDVTFVGISQIESNISIVPNPNNGLFTIDLGNLDVSATTVSIFTVSGQIIYQTNVTDKILETDLTSFTKGIYFVRITSGNKVYNSKIILK